MEHTLNWDFTMANYGPVWSFLVQLGLLLLFLMLGNILRRTIPLFRKCLIPSALLGGALLLVVDIITKSFDIVLVDNRMMQVITYHCLAIGFAAMSLKTEKATAKTRRSQVVEFGALQGGTYMLQAFIGLAITIVFFLLTRYGKTVISYVCGLILPLGFGQGPGNALTWDVNFTNTPAAQFAGNGSFGLSLASIGFVVASVFGVLHINIGKKRGHIQIRPAREETEFVDLTNPCGNEIPDNESVDKFSIQMGFVALAYALAFGFMCLLGVLSDFTNSIAWGFFCFQGHSRKANGKAVVGDGLHHPVIHQDNVKALGNNVYHQQKRAAQQSRGNQTFPEQRYRPAKNVAQHQKQKQQAELHQK